MHPLVGLYADLPFIAYHQRGGGGSIDANNIFMLHQTNPGRMREVQAVAHHLSLLLPLGCCVIYICRRVVSCQILVGYSALMGVEFWFLITKNLL